MSESKGLAKRCPRGLVSRCRGRRPLQLLGGLLAIALWAIISLGLQINYTRSRRPTAEPQIDRTLVVYVYSESDPAYRGNLEYFLQAGVVDDPRIHYVIVIQQDEERKAPTSIPKKQSNLQVVWHPNECFDLGTLGDFFKSGLIELTGYKYFVFLNASVRGPFLPPYWPPGILWTDALTSKITDTVKLVGPTISCGGLMVDGIARQNPHVQSFLLVTDQVGLEIIRADKAALSCYQTKWLTIIHGELGISAAILRAGYNLDSLMLRYQGVDWRDPENWNCNAGQNPFVERMYDGISLHPLEQMFVKVKAEWVQRDMTASVTATTYSRWSMTKGSINTNAFSSLSSLSWRIEALRTCAPTCFDVDYYRYANPELPQEWSDADLWVHFVYMGQFEPRQFRFQCPVEASQPSPILKTYGQRLREALDLQPLDKQQGQHEVQPVQHEETHVPGAKLHIKHADSAVAN